MSSRECSHVGSPSRSAGEVFVQDLADGSPEFAELVEVVAVPRPGAIGGVDAGDLRPPSRRLRGGVAVDQLGVAAAADADAVAPAVPVDVGHVAGAADADDDALALEADDGAQVQVGPAEVAAGLDADGVAG